MPIQELSAPVTIEQRQVQQGRFRSYARFGVSEPPGGGW